jgi:hypothetical protein
MMHFGHFSLIGYCDKGYPPERVFKEHMVQGKLADASGFVLPSSPSIIFQTTELARRRC